MGKRNPEMPCVRVYTGLYECDVYYGPPARRGKGMLPNPQTLNPDRTKLLYILEKPVRSRHKLCAENVNYDLIPQAFLTNPANNKYIIHLIFGVFFYMPNE